MLQYKHFLCELTFGKILYFYLTDDDILNIETCRKLYIAYKIKIIFTRQRVTTNQNSKAQLN